jgi:hypothetical protein
MNLRQFDFAVFGLAGVFYADLDKLGARTDSCVHAASGNQFGLGVFVGRESFEEGDKVVVREVGVVAAKEAADVAAGKAGLPGEVGLCEAPAFCLALECHSEIAHEFAFMESTWFIVRPAKSERNFFVPLVAVYANSTDLQRKNLPSP